LGYDHLVLLLSARGFLIGTLGEQDMHPWIALRAQMSFFVGSGCKPEYLS
jgi:hypothetical protein